jgi:hypothetical protein
LPCRVSPLSPDHLLYTTTSRLQERERHPFHRHRHRLSARRRSLLGLTHLSHRGGCKSTTPLPRLNRPTKDLPFRSQRRFPIVTGRGGRPSLSEISQIGGRGIVLIETSNPQSQSRPSSPEASLSVPGQTFCHCSVSPASIERRRRLLAPNDSPPSCMVSTDLLLCISHLPPPEPHAR